MKVYQFNNILPSPPSFFYLICSHMIFNSSSLFMSISNLILLYNMNMKKANIFCVIFWKDIQIIIPVTSKIRSWVRWDGFRVQNSSRPTKIDSGLESTWKLRITEWTVSSVEQRNKHLSKCFTWNSATSWAWWSWILAPVDQDLKIWISEVGRWTFSCTVEMELRERWQLTLSF
jgi:hypothetical protein